MAFCILNVKTVTSFSGMKSIQHERLREKEYCNVDSSRSHLNRALTAEQDVTQLYNQAMKHDYYSKPDKWGKTHKEPQVKALNLILTYSPEAHLERDPQKLDEWIRDNLDFVRETFQGCPFVATLHDDESTPHIHVSLIPTTPEGKISKNKHIPNKAALVKLQDRYAERMAQYELHRGIHRERNSPELKKATDQYRELRAKIEKQLAQLDRINEKGSTKVSEYNELLKQYDNLIDEHDKLVEAYNGLVREYNDLRERCESFEKYLDLARFRYNEYREILPGLPSTETVQQEQTQERELLDRALYEDR